MDLSYIRFAGAEPPRGVRPVTPGRRTAARVVAERLELEAPPAGALASAVLGHAGLDPTVYRPAPLARRVSACLRDLRADSQDAACRRLVAAPALAGPALSTLLIGVSEFFRDPAVFDLLRHVAVPAARARRRPARILSVGSSSGAELYSAAMLLAEADLLAGARLLGIDCRADAVTAARIGWYDEPALTGVDGDARARYFTETAGGWQVAGQLRRRTRWVQADATRRVPAGPWAMILCRNLAIYLTPAASAALFTRLAAALVPGGHLVVGKAERPPAGLGLTLVGRCVYERHGC